MKKKFFGLFTFIALFTASVLLTACRNGEEDFTINDCIFSAFSAEDFDGNMVDETVFKGYKVTMIHVWGTFCSPCMKEAPGLAELNAEYADKGFQAIGILVDENRATPTDAKRIARDAGADYRQLKISGGLKTFVGGITAYPHTVFVNAEGRQIGNAYTGAKSKTDWKKIIGRMLEFVSESA